MDKLEPMHASYEDVKWGTQLENNLAIPQGVKHELPLTHPQLDMYPRRMKTPVHTNTCTCT